MAPAPEADRARAAAQDRDAARASLTNTENDARNAEFSVALNVFSGPFEVLLSLISRKKLDITDVALAQVTDEFLAFVAAQSDMDLSQVSQFLVVAATLLDLKAARLLPHEEFAQEDLELLEARDLLFAKLLQYRAFKEAAADIAVHLANQWLYVPREVPLEEQFQKALPELEWHVSADYLAMLAAQALTRKAPEITLDHIHAPLVSVESQVRVLHDRLVVGDSMSFTQLCADAHDAPTVVARFLAVLELVRRGELNVEQPSPLAPFVVTRVPAGSRPPAALSADSDIASDDSAAAASVDLAAPAAGFTVTKHAEVAPAKAAPATGFAVTKHAEAETAD